MKPQLWPKGFRVRAIVNVKVKVKVNVGVWVWARVSLSGSFKVTVRDRHKVSV